MKHIIYIFAFAIIGIMIVSCDKNDGAYYPVPSAFSVSPTTAQSVGTDGATIEIMINAGNVGWWVESSQTWCTVSQKYGSGDGKIIVTAGKNTTGTARHAEVTIHPTFKLEPIKIVINQQ